MCWDAPGSIGWRDLAGIPPHCGGGLLGLNPGLLYMATTAMTEPLFLAEMIWAVLLIVQYQRPLLEPESPGAPSPATGFSSAPGWSCGRRSSPATTGGCARPPPGFLRRGRCWPARRRWNWKGPEVGAWVLFSALLIAAPSLWLAYNAKQFGDPLDFMRGPYSARAIEARTTPPGAPPHPGVHNLRVSALYFLKAAQLGAAPLSLGRLLCWLSAAGTLAALWSFRRRQIWPVLLLWLPLPFYAYSVAYGSVPIFIPTWRPFSWYNTRYGMELLPAFALFAGCLIPVPLSRLPTVRRYALGASLLLVVANSVVLLRARPLVFQEAVVNSRSRLAFESALANALLNIPGTG